MNAFLWAFLIVGIFEAGGSVAYLLTGVWPARTKTTIAIGLAIWVAWCAWAVWLLTKGVS